MIMSIDRGDHCTVSQVERGVVPASPAFTAAVARTLRVDVETLTGQPYGPALTKPKADHAGVPALRAALDCVDDPELSGPPISPAELRIRLDSARHTLPRHKMTSPGVVRDAIRRLTFLPEGWLQ